MADELLRLDVHELRAVAIAIGSGRLTPPWSPGAVQRFVPSGLADGVSAALQRLAGEGFSPTQIAATIRLIAVA